MNPSSAMAAGESGLMPIAVSTLISPGHLDFALYLPGSPPRLYRERNYPIRAEDINDLLQSEVRTLYVSASEHGQYKRYLRENLDACLQREELPPLQRFQMLYTVGIEILTDSFKQDDLSPVFHGASEVGQRITKLLIGRNVVLTGLFRVISHDFNTFSHSINVATYCVELAKRFGVEDEADLNRIVMGALLHDIGKLHVAPSILNKAGSLSPSEREMMRQHPQTGFEFLCLHAELSWSQLMMIYQHHERLGGQGYPVGIQGKDIHPWARLCAVVDVFEAMTVRRPYRRALPPLDVLEHLNNGAGITLDKEMVQCWSMAMRAER